MRSSLRFLSRDLTLDTYNYRAFLALAMQAGSFLRGQTITLFLLHHTWSKEPHPQQPFLNVEDVPFDESVEPECIRVNDDSALLILTVDNKFFVDSLETRFAILIMLEFFHQPQWRQCMLITGR